ncbi:DUF11 domain-containing protein [Microbacterium paraoxydans]|uniref:DUF11 domain-containing protein n=1 Tax=Microbacterium paraoxydans TaxID=199592 RepID=UPI001CFB7B3F|nr:DUF11 domain-containing protein [Microbacterium paraoxydans]
MTARVQGNNRRERKIRKPRRLTVAATVGALVAGVLSAVSPLGGAPSAFAAPGDPFDPAAPVVFIAQGDPSQMQRAETTGDGSFAFSNEGGPAAVGYNAIAFNPADNYMYGMVTNTFTPGIPRGSLVRIAEGGVVTRIGSTVYTHPGGSTRFYSGAFNPADGLYYISDSAPNTTMLALNVATGAVVSTLDFGQQPDVQDFAFADGFAWGANNAGDLRRINVTTGGITVFPGVMPTTTGGYGGVWNFGNGNLGFSANATGNVVQLEIVDGATATPTFRVVNTVAGPSSSLNDGTSIPGLPADLEVSKTASATFESGDRISYEITVTNNGAGFSSGWSVSDTLPAGLSNPEVIGDFSDSYDGNVVTISGGGLAPGESATFQIEADTDVAAGTCLENTATVLGNEEDPVPENDSDTAITCDLALTLEKSSDATADSRPGDVITYTVTATNTGEGDFTEANPAVVFDDLSGVLDDATYNDDAAATVTGDLGYAAPLLSWSGALAAGASVDITYSVTLESGGDGEVRNVTWRPGDPGVTTPPACDPAVDGVDPVTGEPCAVVQFELPRLTIDKSADSTELPAVGEQLTYTITVTNEGPGDYTATAPATATDDLTDVLDDATFDDASLSASTGTVTRTGNDLVWEGPLAAGDQVVITFSVTYTGDGDQILRNQACVPASATLPGAPSCDVVEVPGAALSQWKSASASSDPVVAGSTITYTLYFDNDGQTAATVDAVDDLTYVLDDASVTSGPVSADGLTVALVGDQILISGSVPVGEVYTVEYTVTVNADGERGDSVATNFLLPPGEEPPPGGVCTPADDEQPNCTSTPITGISYVKSVVASETPVVAGTELEYSITIENTGSTEVDVLRDDLLADVLDDATLTGAPESDTSSVTVAGPTDDVLEIRGTIAGGATAVVTYTVTVNEQSAQGNSVATNFLVPPGETPEPCVPGSPECTTTPIQAYTVTKSAGVDEVAPGGTVTYTVTVENTGAVAFTDADPATFTDDLADVLDDAVYNDDVSAGGSVAGGVLSWAGALDVGEVLTVTYSVTVNDPTTGDLVLTNAVVPDAPGGECATACVTETPVASFAVTKEADVAEVMPGDIVTYTVTVTNTGATDYTDASPASFEDDLSGVLDDATYNDDVSAGGSVDAGILTWSGELAVDQVVTVTYSVTVNDPATGDQQLLNAVVPTAPGGSCVSEGDCETTTDVASYTVTKETSSETALPGDVITYTVTVTNTGEVAYTEADPASFEDDLSGVLDDAVYNDDVTGGGVVTGNTLTWEGALGVGEVVTVSYSVTVDDPIVGDFAMRNVVTPTGPGGECDGICETETLVASFAVEKSTTTTEVVPGDVIEYTITVTNIGEVAYTAGEPASFTDDLSEVLDDAVYNGDAQSSTGTGVAYTAPELAWSGALDVDATVTVTYSVTVNDPATGDSILENAVVTPPGTGGNCAPGSTDPDCISIVPAASFSIAKTVEPTTALPGEVVTYTVTVENTGAVAYTDEDPASFVDDLSRVLDDAVYNDDVSAGGEIDGDVLTWSGPLAIGETLQVTYSVTVDDPVEGDFVLRNVVAPSSPGGECADGGCVTETAVASYSVEKIANVEDITLGGEVTYEVTVTNIGQVPYSDENPASFVDDLSGVLDDATYNDDASAGAVVSGDELSWSGALAVGETVTVSYSVTVNQPMTGDGLLFNAVAADGPGGACTDDDGCVTETPVATFRVLKEVSATQAVVGDDVRFTITVTNTGQVPYTQERPASFTDDLTDVLRLGSYKGSATGGAAYEAPVLSWEGALDVGESVTVTYTVTLERAGEFRNVVTTPEGTGANCPAGSTDDDCDTVTRVITSDLATTGGVAAIGAAALSTLLLGLGAWLAVRRRREEQLESL